MNDISIAVNNTNVLVKANPVSAKSVEFPDGQAVALDGPLTITKESGDGALTTDPEKPLEFIAVTDPTKPGDTVYAVAGRDASGNIKSGKVTVTVTLALDDLGLTAEQVAK